MYKPSIGEHADLYVRIQDEKGVYSIVGYLQLTKSLIIPKNLDITYEQYKYIMISGDAYMRRLINACIPYGWYVPYGPHIVPDGRVVCRIKSGRTS